MIRRLTQEEPSDGKELDPFGRRCHRSVAGQNRFRIVRKAFGVKWSSAAHGKPQHSSYATVCFDFVPKLHASKFF